MSLFGKLLRSEMRWKVVFLLFLAGLGARMVIFAGPHREGDECIYMALVEQIDKGNGYSLQGTRFLERGSVDEVGYDKPYFFHPPGGVGLFWIFYEAFGLAGFPLAQLACYALFFWCLMRIAAHLGIATSRAGLVATAALAAITPIMAHVSARYWLDGPQLAFCTASGALFLSAARRESAWRAAAAGLLLGYAALIKITAVLIVPGLALLAWSFLERPRLASMIRLLVWYGGCAALAHLPWEIWLWIRVGTPFPGWAGKPSAHLVATNKYVHYLTVVRSPWIYLSLVPRIVWTVVPGLLLLPVAWSDRAVRWRALSLYLWIAVVLAFHVAVGMSGYSKVVRYVILLTPASVLVFGLLVSEASRRFDPRALATGRNGWIAAALLAAAAGLALEIAAGIHVTVHFDRNLIVPIIGGM